MFDALLASVGLQTDWHLSYGLTEKRKDALVEDKGNSDSFLNDNSETALTLFMLGRLDKWRQCTDLQTRPRTDDGWNKTFFDNLRSGQANYRCDPTPTPLTHILASILGAGEEVYRSGVLQFELEVRNRAFYGGATPTVLSFLNISQKWSEFDAVIMVPPPTKLFVFVEAKLGADVSRKTRYFPYVSQIIRNLESAFFLCQPTSEYRGWDFRYILLCPDKDYKYRSTYYSCVLDGIGSHIRIYKDILRTEYHAKASHQRIDQLFESFERSIPEKIRILHWTSLWTQLVQDGFQLSNYESAIRTAMGVTDGDAACLAFRNRLLLAGISPQCQPPAIPPAGPPTP